MQTINKLYGYLLLSFYILSLLQGFGLTDKVFCAELRPYELPSQKIIPYRQQQALPPEKSPFIEFDYAAFGERASKLKPEDKVRLKRGLEERLNESKQQRNYTMERHYERLLEVIGND